MSNYKLVPVELLKDWHKRINTIAVETAFDVADEMGAMLSATPQPAVTVPEIIEAVANFVGSQEGGPFTPAVIKAAIIGQLKYGDAFTKLFTSPAPQPAEQKSAPGVEGPINVSYTDDNGAVRRSPADCRHGVRYVTVSDTVYWPLSADDAQRLRSAEFGRGDFAGPSTSTDVTALAEALEWIRGAINCTPENDKHQSGAWISTRHPRIRQIDELLAAHRKGGDQA